MNAKQLVNTAKMLLAGDKGPIGEAWLLSDRDDYASLVANGPLKGRTIGQLIEQSPEQLLGKISGCFRRVPLLLKFLDAREMLSVQVHPSDRQTEYLPYGEHGKTEAWVVLETGPESIIYVGLKHDTTPEDLRQALAWELVRTFLAAQFSVLDRHRRRLSKVAELEKRRQDHEK